MNYLKNLFLELLVHIEGFSLAFWNAVEPVLASAAKTTVADILPIALQFVGELAANSTLTGAQKQASAKSQIIAVLEQQGISAAESVVNLAIEMAVTQLGVASAAPVASPAPAPAVGS